MNRIKHITNIAEIDKGLKTATEKKRINHHRRHPPGSNPQNHCSLEEK